MADAPLHRILSLDGGGSWALIEARALHAIYGDMSGHELLSRFDYVAANSGGSMVLAALACDMKLSEVEGLFSQVISRRKIFVDLPFWDELSRPLGVGAKYSTTAKLAGLISLLPDAVVQLTDLPARIAAHVGRSPQFLITAFDFDRRKAVFFRSNPASLAASYSRQGPVQLVEAVHASSTAPVNYFDDPAAVGGNRYWDGGVGAHNNPVLAAVVEAIANKTPVESIRVLSLGTGHLVRPLEDGIVKPPLATPKDSPGLLHDVQEMATSVLDDPPDAASFVAHVMLGQKLPTSAADCIGDGALVRMNPLISLDRSLDGTWHAPAWLASNEAQFKALADLDMDAVNNDQVALIQTLCTAWLNNRAPNQPIRANADFQPEIGHATFGEACDAWKRFDSR